MALVGSFLFNSFMSRFLSCIGTAVLAGMFLTFKKHTNTYKSLEPERAFADFVLCNFRVHRIA
ncbi:hypothetical protein F2Q70_00026632 [Brassica cretica]|uniref:Dolichyl-diphosphooligosaccharide--protein glycosyltransferase subunit DAD1 n=1 Tax=Brassica cretica TaxID=69181 RepID=A0A8S9LDF4_BRACR|nr:hypothetical protein F2Q70_00026632 [Brassica cretica]